MLTSFLLSELQLSIIAFGVCLFCNVVFCVIFFSQFLVALFMLFQTSNSKKEKHVDLKIEKSKSNYLPRHIRKIEKVFKKNKNKLL